MRLQLRCMVALFFVALQFSFAQEKTITGTVKDGAGLQLPGVTVRVKGTTNGTQTDFDGNYTISAEVGQVLRFSYVGMKTVEKKIGNKTKIDVTLTVNAEELEAVVVTGALGMSKDERSLGYAVQELSSEELNKVKQTDAISALSGKAAGVQISSGSGVSGSNRILIRGANSIFGENQPLFIVDGVPMDNSNFNSTGAQAGYGGIDYGNMLNDLNPDDIENISVLKGAAAAIYGSRASNGVILITTKKGKIGRDILKLDINSSIEFENVTKIPALQRKYGGGAIIPDDKGGVNGFEQVTIEGKTYNVPQYGIDESWGPRYNENLTYLPWSAFSKESYPNEYLKPVPWVAPEKDVKDFFETGVKYVNSVSVSKSGENYGLRFGYTNTNLEGYIPNAKQNKNNLSLNGNIKFLDKVKVSSGINYSRQKTFARPTFGYDSNSFSQKFYQWGQRQLDFGRLKGYKNKDGSQRTWNRKAWNNATPEYSDNPYWTVYENYSDDERDRFFGNLNLSYEFIKGLSLKGSIYGDTYTFYNRERTAVGSQSTSSYYEAVRNNYEFNYELTLNYITNLTKDISLTALLGGNKRVSRYTFNRQQTAGGLVVAGLWDINNSVGNVSTADYTSKKQVNSLFGSMSLGFKDMLYLDLTARNDWSSTLPEANNSFFYPSASLGFVFSELIENSESWLSFGKLRFGLAQVGNDTSPYRVSTTYQFNSNGPFNSDPRLHAPVDLNNSDLKPEKTTSIEVGTDIKLFRNRVGLAFTWYKNTTTDQIIPLDISKTTGYASKYINAGKMQNSGIELTVDVTPIRNEDFRWDFTVNFSKNNNKLLSLYEDLDKLQITRAPFRQVYLMAKVGEKYGQLVGYDFVYDNKGNKVLNADGFYERTKELQSLGSVLPDYNMGIRNSIKYKNIDFNFLFDIQKGGKYYSLTHMWGMYSGMLGESAGVNDKGNEIRSSVEKGGGIKLPGVTGDIKHKDDGSYVVSNTKPNEKYIEGKRWGASFYSSKIGAMNVFDADYIKLREVNLGYTFSNFKVGSFDKLRISVYGKNLWTFGLAWDGFDPEVTVGGSGNIQGIEGGFIPSTASYGVNIQFGF